MKLTDKLLHASMAAAERGDFREEHVLLRRCLVADPTNIKAMTYLSQNLILYHQYSEALDILYKAESLDPTNLMVMLSMNDLVQAVEMHETCYLESRTGRKNRSVRNLHQ